MEVNSVYSDSLEIARLINLDRMLTAEMGDIFAGLSMVNLPVLQTILDLGCGSGSWVLDVAFAHPECEVAGVDIDLGMVRYAWARARSQRLLNASFGMMDITEPLDFSEDTFDLVNARFLAGSLHKENWAPLLAECMRVIGPGGLVCFLDTDGIVETNSAAFIRLAKLMMHIWRLGGYCLTSDEGTLGTASILPQLLRRAGFQDVECRLCNVDVSAGSAAWTDFFHSAEIFYLQAQPLILATGLMTQAELNRLYSQMLIELQMSDFWGRWPLLTISGKKCSSPSV